TSQPEAFAYPVLQGRVSKQRPWTSQLARHLPAGLDEAVTATARAAYVHGLHAAALVGAVLLVAAAVATLARRSGSGRALVGEEE
ncbi:MAG: hypothetical protein ACXVD1_14975, partial [Nocardioides sp.]